MEGLEHEAHMLAPQLGEVLGTGARDGMAIDANRSFGRLHHASEDREQRGLAAAGGPHQERQLAARDRKTHALEGLDLAGALAEQLHHIDGLDDGFGHRVNTIAGSMRVTCTIAAIAESTHMTTVSANRTSVNPGVITIGKAESAVAATTISPIPAASPNPMTALIRAWQMMTLWM
jgi:hypothetical protein